MLPTDLPRPDDAPQKMAEHHLRRAVALSQSSDPSNDQSNNGVLMPLNEAVAHARLATLAWPIDAAVWNTLGSLLEQRARLQTLVDYRKSDLSESLSALQQAEKRSQGQSKGGLTRAIQRNLAIVEHLAGRLKSARQRYEKILAPCLENIDAECNVSIDTDLLASYAKLLMQNGDPVAAEQHYRLLISLLEKKTETTSALPEAHFGLAYSLHLQGRSQEAWPHFEYRYHPDNQASDAVHLPDLPCPRWQGEPLNGKRLLLWPEQGLGDYLQFLRYVPELLAKDAEVTLVCPPPLHDLLKAQDWNVACLRTDTLNWQQPSFDYYTLPLSLPGHVDTPVALDRAKKITPYLSVPETYLTKWQRIFEQLGAEIPHKARYKIGLVWAGNARHVEDEQRSIPLEDFTPLAQALPEAQFFSLQLGPHADDTPPPELALKSLHPHIENLADTAAAMMQLDLIVSVDSAPAHLAGALGQPVLTLLAPFPDWRWGLNNTDTPWYPTMQLWRRTADQDWHDNLKQLSDAFQEKFIKFC